MNEELEQASQVYNIVMPSPQREIKLLRDNNA